MVVQYSIGSTLYLGIKMLYTQLQPCLAPRAPWGQGNKAFDNGCQFCATSRRFVVVTTPAVWDQTVADNNVFFADWYQFGGSGLSMQSGGSRCESGNLSSKRTAFVLMENGEGAITNPMKTENSSMTYLRGIKKKPHLGVARSNKYISTIALPSVVPRTLRTVQLSVVDQAFLLLGFIACTASFSLFALIVTAIPTLHAMRRAAVSVEKLADIAREELPGTMAAIRLSGMEISDLTLELNELSQEISDGVRNSARAVQAAEVGIRRIGAIAASQTFAMLQETASVPVQVVRPAVVSAAATTLHAVSQAQKLVFSLASSSYPHISGWLWQRGTPSKQQKDDAAEVSSATATLTELLTGEEMTGGPLLSGSSQLSLFDDSEGDEGTMIRVRPGSDN